MIKENKERALVDFYELSPEWQKVAKSNNECDYEDCLYIEPLPEHIAGRHVLLDLSECMRVENNPDYDGYITVSNACSIGVKLSECGSVCKLTFF